MSRYPAGHKDETRQRILDVAGRLFRTEGYVATGVAKLMSATGLTVGGFYAHFDSKESLLAEVLSRSLEQTRAVMLAGLDGVDGFPFIREVAKRYLSRLHRDAAADGCSLPSLAAEVSRQGPETRQTFDAYFNELVDGFAGRLPAGRGMTPRDRAIALTALFVGGITFARAVEDRELSDRILLACKRFAVADAPESAAEEPR